ncbi:hypothetical protein [Acidianus brierleyi]|uniref:hypothetical protein n=1 Tax=Acidianus brierleyi TaxID=41673 RepID=UPI001FE3C1E1|nr:hypothetical protein [Acidianus brierleyi]
METFNNINPWWFYSNWEDKDKHSLLDKIPSSISFNSIASDLGISHNTVSEYIEFLTDIFLIDVAYLKSGNEIVNSFGSSSYRLAMLEAKHVEPIHLLTDGVFRPL